MRSPDRRGGGEFDEPVADIINRKLRTVEVEPEVWILPLLLADTFLVQIKRCCLIDQINALPSVDQLGIDVVVFDRLNC